MLQIRTSDERTIRRMDVTPPVEPPHRRRTSGHPAPPGKVGEQRAVGAEAQDVQRVRRAYELPEEYLLFVGTVEPRKDLPGLVAAFDAVAAEDPDLRLVMEDNTIAVKLAQPIEVAHG